MSIYRVLGPGVTTNRSVHTAKLPTRSCPLASEYLVIVFSRTNRFPGGGNFPHEHEEEEHQFFSRISTLRGNSSVCVLPGCDIYYAQFTKHSHLQHAECKPQRRRSDATAS